jgi:hypothetical protein
MQVKLHKRKFDEYAVRSRYLQWLIKNPRDFENFCRVTKYYRVPCKPFAPQQTCCLGHYRAPEPPEESEDELEIVVPQGIPPE